MRKGKRAIVTGAPGAGKTTLLRYRAGLALDEGRFPVFLELKTLSGRDLAKKDGSILNVLFDQAVTTAMGMEANREEDRAFLRERFAAAVKDGRAVLFLDGLDETTDRRTLCQWISDAALSGGTLILSSRPYALHQTRIENAEEMEIAPLSDRQVKEFVEHYFPSDSANPGFLAELQTSPQLRDMARTPVLLATLFDLYRKQRLGTRVTRLEVYEEIVRRLAQVLDQERNVAREFLIPDPDGSIKLSFLERLAGDRLLSAGATAYADRYTFPARHIVEKAREYMQERGPGIVPEHLAADVKATALLREIGNDVYVFSHLTLQEYLAAGELARRKDPVEELCRKAFEPVLAGGEVLAMALGRLSDAAYAALAALPDSLDFVLFRLQARGLAYGPASEQIAENLAARLAEMLIRHRPEERAYIELIAQSFRGIRGEAERRVSRPVAALLLDDERESVRWRAAKTLRELGAESAIEALASALRDKNSKVCWQAGEALGEIGGERALEALLGALRDEREDVRASGTYALGKIGGERAVEALAGALRDPNESVRCHAVSALRQIGGERALEALVSALRDEGNYNRGYFASALGRIGRERTVEALTGVLRDRWEHVRRSAAAALKQIGGERGLDALVQALRDERVDVRVSAAWALGPSGGERALETALNALHDERKAVRQNAAETLGEFGGERALEALVKTLSDETTYVRWSAAKGLGQIGGERALEALVRALGDKDLRDKDSTARENAARALGRIGGERAAEALVGALHDEGPLVRGSAARSLGQIGGEREVEALFEARCDEHGYIWRNAAFALGQIQSRSVEAFDRGLKRALNHANPAVRNKVLECAGYYALDPEWLRRIQQVSKTDAASEVRSAAAEAQLRFARKLVLFGFQGVVVQEQS